MPTDPLMDRLLTLEAALRDLLRARALAESFAAARAIPDEPETEEDEAPKPRRRAAAKEPAGKGR